ncbi:hypothetical protein GmRootA79_08830 [Acidovorax sp. A79]|uniref:hypothetical protein n=1 Tax=Acidovorax sp. A79 TaxID=3056107 RepID=UPI0034E8BA97
MTLYINGSKTVGNGGLAGEYLATGNNSGVFIDMCPYTFGSTGTPHSGVAFFCNDVPAGAPDNQIWSGQARGVTFWKNGDNRVIKAEDWLGGANNFYHYPIGTWEPGVVYRVTATYTATDVQLAVYKTDNAGNVIALTASAVRPLNVPNSKGTHACVFATDGSTVGCTPVALYP